MGVPVLNVHLDSAETLDLLEKSGDAHHAPVTDDALRVRLNDADRHQVERHGLSIDNDGVSGVGASGSTAAEVVSTRNPSIGALRTYLRSYPPAFPFPHRPTGNPSPHPP